MTGIEAQQIIAGPHPDHPVTRDAHIVFQMAEDLILARLWAAVNGLIYPHPKAAMETEHEAVEAELKHWREQGWRSEQ